ncbi:MAG: hypothetical protein ACI8X5_001922 [Planctomycetota bacterium]|jgi:hypothetical protein
MLYPMKFTTPLSFLVVLALGAGVLNPTAQGAIRNSGGTFDLEIVSIEVTQAVQYGSTGLVGGRSTMVRVGAIANGTIPPGTAFDGLVRVLVNGVEASFSPLYSLNGPQRAEPMISNSVLDDTLNFVFLPPQSGNVEIIAEVNPAGATQVSETDFSNNILSSGALDFQCRAIPELVYVPIDYRPSGGGPNVPDTELIKPGVGDNFIQGIFPLSDWEYRRSDAPSKLWTSSLQSTGSALNASLLTDLQMTVPQPDFIYGWVPGSLPYNGQAIGIPGQAGIGNTQLVRYQRTFAHELGHLVGRSHNSTSVNTAGIDVEHHLALTEGLPQIQNNKVDIMVPGQVTSSAWVANTTYNAFLAYSVFSCSAALVADSGAGNRLLVSGIWNPEVGQLDLGAAVAFQGGLATEPHSKADSDLIMQIYSGNQMLAESGIQARNSSDSCPECNTGSDSNEVFSQESGFVHVFPASISPTSIDRLVVINALTGEVLSERLRSQSSPQLAFISPTKATPLGHTLHVSWTGSDQDGDDLVYYLRYSPDGESFVPLATAIRTTSYDIPFGELPELSVGNGFLELIATDGLNSTSLRTVSLGGASGEMFLGGGNPPEVHVLTPDTGQEFPRAATVLLHSSGWDLEDKSINGTSIVWTSDIDGAIATGRMTSVANLSVGVHTITATGTDSGGLPGSDFTTITITNRPLPGTSGAGTPYCFGDGSGNDCPCAANGGLEEGCANTGGTGAVLVASGVPSFSNDSFQLSVSGIPGEKTGLAIKGSSQLLGNLVGDGLLCTTPQFRSQVITSDISGNATMPDWRGQPFSMFPGAANMGSATFYQWWYRDPANTCSGQGFNFTNAWTVTWLP